MYSGILPVSQLSQKYCPSGALGSLRHSGWKLAGQRSQQMRVPPCEQRKHQLAFTCIDCFDDDDLLPEVDEEEDFDDFDFEEAEGLVNRAMGSLGSEVCYRKMDRNEEKMKNVMSF